MAATPCRSANGSIFRVVHWQARVAGRDGQAITAVRHQSVDRSHRPGEDNRLNRPGVRFDRSLRRGDRGGGTSARFSARRKQGGRRGPRSKDSKRFARSAISILLRGPRRPPCFLRVKILPACGRHMFPPLSEATADSSDCPVVSFCLLHDSRHDDHHGRLSPDSPAGVRPARTTRMGCRPILLLQNAVITAYAILRIGVYTAHRENPGAS